MPERLLDAVQAIIDAHPDWEHIRAAEVFFDKDNLLSVNVYDARTYWVDDDRLRREIPKVLRERFPGSTFDDIDNVFRIHPLRPLYF